MTATATSARKFDRRAIATAAWTIARACQKAHRNLRKAAEFLGYGMKQAWTKAKAAVAVAATPATEIKISYSKTDWPASYKQYAFLCDLGVEIPVNSSQFQARVSMPVASEAISLAKAGKKVRFILA